MHLSFRFNDFRVWPTLVEAELQKHPAVRECMIYGKQNPTTMELVAASIVLKPGYTKVSGITTVSAVGAMAPCFKGSGIPWVGVGERISAGQSRVGRFLYA